MHKPFVSCKRNKSGVTLLELLVVTAIIGILFACVAPALKKGINSANRAKCLGNLRLIGIAAEQYTQENNNTFPPVDYWPNKLCPYLLNKVSATFAPHTKTVFWCPAADPSDLGPGFNGNIAYSINAQGYAGLGRFQETSVNGLRTAPSKLIAFMDGNSANMWDTTPQRVRPWHGDCYNVFFADSHAETLQNKQYAPGSTAWRNLLWGYARY